jgi:hypothetical protein
MEWDKKPSVTGVRRVSQTAKLRPYKYGGRNVKERLLGNIEKKIPRFLRRSTATFNCAAIGGLSCLHLAGKNKQSKQYGS